MNTQEKIAVMQAYLDGRPIESRYMGDPNWYSHQKACGDPAWDWVNFNYRIAPPKPVPHKHAAVIKAWADGAKVECRLQGTPFNMWKLTPSPSFSPTWEYRVAP